jgi:uncharacterized protein (TIGR02246 family)
MDSLAGLPEEAGHNRHGQEAQWESWFRGDTTMFTSNYQRVKYLVLLALVVALILALTGCQQPAPKAPDTRAADETAIRAVIDDQAKAISAWDAAKAASFYTNDVVGMAPDAPVLQGKENMQKYLESMMREKPEFSFNTVKVEVARSGDLAYNWGTGKMTAKDKKGKVTATTFKSASVWKKQSDGAWKMVVDTWSPDPVRRSSKQKKLTTSGRHPRRGRRKTSSR